MTELDFKTRVMEMTAMMDPHIGDKVQRKLVNGATIEDLYIVCVALGGGVLVNVLSRLELQCSMEEYGDGEYRMALETLLGRTRTPGSILALFMENGCWAIMPAMVLNSPGGTA